MMFARIDQRPGRALVVDGWTAGGLGALVVLIDSAR